MLAEQARDHSFLFVDFYTNSVGHDACQPPGVKWEGTVTTSQAAAIHPNATGMAAVGAFALATFKPPLRRTARTFGFQTRWRRT
ncbi:MAG: hypothetical protein JO287_25700 [Pseudonocardiales bacterium]|nr:hypothetical protein [Pseudonocardiales bacterium]